MKLKRILVFGIILVLIAATLLTTVLLTYSPLRYRAKMYSYCNEWIDPAFLESNKLRATYDNPNYDENEGPTPENPVYFQDLTLPSNRTFLITDEETFEEIFTANPIEVNFNEEMIVLYMFIDGVPSTRNYSIKKIEVEGDMATVYFKSDKKPWDDRKDAVRPWHRCMVVKMKKLDISTVTVTKVR